jgi:hypothetical protein
LQYVDSATKDCKKAVIRAFRGAVLKVKRSEWKRSLSYFDFGVFNERLPMFLGAPMQNAARNIKI